MRYVYVPALLLPLLVGCSFDRQWRQLVREPEAKVQNDALSGRWEGKWVSDASGHSGKLRAIITKTDAMNYRANFDAKFLAIFRFDHATTLTGAATRNGTIEFKGEENLGSMAGGVYKYAGQADGKTFASTYQSSNDHGHFRMTRPAK
jgi:hypothetical protein